MRAAQNLEFISFDELEIIDRGYGIEHPILKSQILGWDIGLKLRQIFSILTKNIDQCIFSMI